MMYEFWDVRSNNLVDAVPSETEAREMLCQAIEEQGEWIVEWLMLLEDDPGRDEKLLVGIGSELLDFARGAA